VTKSHFRYTIWRMLFFTFGIAIALRLCLDFLPSHQPSHLDVQDINRIRLGEPYVVLVESMLYDRREKAMSKLMVDNSFVKDVRGRSFSLGRYRCTESPKVDNEFNFNITGLDAEVMNGCPVTSCAVVVSKGKKRVIPYADDGLQEFQLAIFQAIKELESNN